MPDLVGMKVNCPKCQHPFTVPLITRRARVTIPNASLPVPDGASSSDPFSGILDDSELKLSDVVHDDEDDPRHATAVPLDPETTEPANPTIDASDDAPTESPTSISPSTPSDAQDAPVSSATPQPISAKPRRPARSRPRPIPVPDAPAKPAERNLRQSTSLHLGLALIALGVFALPLPLGMPSLRHVGLVLCLGIMLFGSVICAVSLFRQHIKWIFGATTCALLGLVIFANGGIDFSPTSSSTLPPDVVAAVPAQPRPTTSEPATAPTRSPIPGYQSLVNRYHQKHVVRIIILPPPHQRPDTSLAAKARETFRPLATSWSLIRRPDHLECALAPIDDLQALAKTLSSTGTVSNIDEQTKTITFRF